MPNSVARRSENKGKTYYTALNLPTHPAPTFPEIKAAYRRALLLHHPDKKRAPHNDVSQDSEKAITVDEIGRAYHTLSDSRLRAEYDSRQLPLNGDGYDSNDGAGDEEEAEGQVLDLDEMVFHPATGTNTVAGKPEDGMSAGRYTHACARCGAKEGYTLPVRELELYEEEFAVGSEDGHNEKAVRRIGVACSGCSLCVWIEYFALS